jgi:hypothetical protein
MMIRKSRRAKLRNDDLKTVSSNIHRNVIEDFAALEGTYLVRVPFNLKGVDCSSSHRLALMLPRKFHSDKLYVK